MQKSQQRVLQQLSEHSKQNSDLNEWNVYCSRLYALSHDHSSNYLSPNHSTKKISRQNIKGTEETKMKSRLGLFNSKRSKAQWVKQIGLNLQKCQQIDQKMLELIEKTQATHEKWQNQRKSLIAQLNFFSCLGSVTQANNYNQVQSDVDLDKFQDDESRKGYDQFQRELIEQIQSKIEI